MKIIKAKIWVLLVLVILCGSVVSQDKVSDKEIRSELVGVWQDSSTVGSGMSDNYQFFSNGRYRFNYNSMDGTKRLLSHSGYWKVVKGKLVLKMRKVSLLLGGKWVKASGSTATDYEIEGGKEIEQSVSSKEALKLNLGKILTEDPHKTILIDGIKYWKLSSDPKTYEN